MKSKVKLICLLAIILIITSIMYTGLHELGHCLIAVLCGATITDVDLFNRSMSYMGGHFNNITSALLHIAGATFPVIICLVLLYAKRKASFIYNLFVVVFCLNTIISVGALQAWVIVPLLSVYSTASASDDVIKFINVLDIHPMFVSAIAIVFVIGFIVVILKGKYRVLSRQLSEQIKV